MKTLNALTVRKKFGSVIDEVHENRKPIVISRANQPLVVLVPYEDYEAYENQRARRERLRKVARRMDEWRQAHAKKTKNVNTTKLIRELRESR